MRTKDIVRGLRVNHGRRVAAEEGIDREILRGKGYPGVEE